MYLLQVRIFLNSGMRAQQTKRSLYLYLLELINWNHLNKYLIII